ncbi:ATP-grasp domain-containing protein [Piscirickettsia salmonis]|nr:ATP-grasp domain-containing protein [Piscirickettsia salmonis]QHS27290.1 ATP-grasp domain-containing protein [Piscirickettsia salmonis]QHS30488.1 ATP-grasp domain-containing protein [Piscirickettsia salmonis]
MSNSRFIAKPTDPAGSYGVELIQSQNNLNDYHEKYLSTNKNFIAEQFISGKMYHCDFIIYGNKSIFKACSEYLFPNLDFKVGKTLSSIPVFNKQIQSVILNFSDQCLRSLGYHNGIYHLELFIKNNQLYFLEVGARIPASLVIKMYEITYGVNIADLSIAALTDSIPTSSSAQQKTTGNYFLWAYLAKTQGTIKKLIPPSLSSKFDIHWQVDVGQEILNSTSIIDRIGILTSTSNNLDTIQQDFEYLRQYCPLVVEQSK